jgi:hypothetical protein
MLQILYVDNYPQSRREMGLSLGRLLDAESKYIELTRRIDEDPGTALAQEMESLRNILSKSLPGQDELFSHLLQAREEFARGQLASGFQPLLAVVDLVKAEETQLHLRQILEECSLRIRESGKARMEYPTLAIVAMGNRRE